MQVDDTNKEEGVGSANDMAPIPDNPSKKIKFCEFCEPVDPQEAVEHFNWKMMDFGGNGGCFYRCVLICRKESTCET